MKRVKGMLCNDSIEMFKNASLGTRIDVPEIDGVVEVVKAAHATDCDDCVFEGYDFCPYLNGEQTCIGDSLKYCLVDGTAEPVDIQDKAAKSEVLFIQVNNDMVDIPECTKVSFELGEAGKMLQQTSEALKDAQTKYDDALLLWRNKRNVVADMLEVKPVVMPECEITVSPTFPTIEGIPAVLFAGPTDQDNKVDPPKPQLKGGKTTQKEQIFNFICDAGNVSIPDIRKRFPVLSKGSLTGRCSDLVKEGRISLSDFGIYSVPKYDVGVNDNTQMVSVNPRTNRRVKIKSLVNELASDGNTIGIREIADYTEIRYNNAAQILSTLCQRGEIARRGAGRYVSVVSI